MAKTDGLKEEIASLRPVFGLLVAIEVSLIAWLAQHFRTAEIFLLLAAIALALLAAGGIIAVAVVFHRRIAELKEV